MKSKDFIQNVKSRVDLTQFELYRRGFDRIPAAFHERYLQTLEYCPHPSAAYDLLYKGRLLPEENYMRFLQFMCPRVHYA